MGHCRITWQLQHGLPPGIQIKCQAAPCCPQFVFSRRQDAKLVSALANGQRLPVFPGTERGHPSFEVQVAIPPGQSGELSFQPFRTDVSGCTARSDSAVGGHCHSRSIGARMLGISRRRTKRSRHVRFRSVCCYPHLGAVPKLRTVYFRRSRRRQTKRARRDNQR